MHECIPYIRERIFRRAYSSLPPFPGKTHRRSKPSAIGKIPHIQKPCSRLAAGFCMSGLLTGFDDCNGGTHAAEGCEQVNQGKI